LALLTIVVFARVAGNDFVNYDDPDYVTANPYVQHGLTWEGIQWAFANLHGTATYWHPLTWISHMLDFQLFGLHPAGHHLTNLGLHTINVLLLFTLLVKLTGAVWRSAFVAAIFAIHPLQVDSVAWITERKNLLSGLFWFLTLLAYLRYVERRTVRDYVLVLFFFALGLMCKPVLVTLPAAMLLLDLWPLRRWAPLNIALDSDSNLPRRDFGSLLVEKIPFFALSIASALITVSSHEGLGISQESHGLPVGLRIENAFVSYARYLGKVFVPVKLAVLYPHPGKWPAVMVWASLALLVLITIIAIWRFRRRPYVLVGWLWFLGVLFPASGVLQVGVQAMADRFIYLPMIGLLIAIVWLASDFVRIRLPLANTRAVGMAALIVVAALAFLTSRQTTFWKDSIALWGHTIAVTGPNPLAHNNLAYAFYLSGKFDNALAHAQKAVELRPDFGEPRLQMGMIYDAKRQPEPAIAAYREAVRIHENWPLARKRLADDLAKTGKTSEAIAEFEALLVMVPGDVESRSQLADLLSQAHRDKEATEQYREALRWMPNRPETLNNLAWILATSPDAQVRNGKQAIRYASEACELTQRKQPLFIGTLAAAYAEDGQFDDAVRTAGEASKAATAAGSKEISSANERLKQLYLEHKPARQQ